MSIGIDSLDILPEKVAGTTEFKVIKVKVGDPNDAETLRVLRSLVVDKAIRVDATAAGRGRNALERANRLTPSISSSSSSRCRHTNSMRSRSCASVSKSR